MSRLGVFAILGLLFINISCERCMRCRYSYSETLIIETPDGEEEQKIEYTDKILLDANGEAFGEECFKSKEFKNDAKPFTIENYYEFEESNTDLDDFVFTCNEL